MKKTLILAIAVSLLFAGIAFGAGVLSSKHDMRLEDAGNQSASTAVCEFCHHPHRGVAPTGFGTSILLWNKNFSTAGTYPPYVGGSTMGATAGTVNMSGNLSTNGVYASALCMSCHDGVNANNSVIRMPRNGGTQLAISYNVAASNLGTTLADDHPVNFLLSDDMTDDIPVATDVVWSTYKLFGGYFQCATCHDVHAGTSATVQFMRGPVENSAICIACHTTK